MNFIDNASCLVFAGPQCGSGCTQQLAARRIAAAALSCPGGLATSWTGRFIASWSQTSVLRLHKY
ncbi:hypothetical protein NKI79_02625 [Mesorhizobium sp. M0340]|uniref:hypothetical protein n=1 Tax=Mesorhizobium sp. M0340 TaxID=2956939 RepID=UPI003337D58D